MGLTIFDNKGRPVTNVLLQLMQGVRAPKMIVGCPGVFERVY